MDTIKKNISNLPPVQIGGKGSIRRKRRVVKRQSKNVFLETLKTKANFIVTQGIPKIDENIFNYLDIFHRDLLKKFALDDRKRGKSKNINQIKKELLDIVRKNKYDKEFITYCGNYLNDGALNTINRYLDLIADVIKEKEYNAFMEFKNKTITDKDIVEAFKYYNVSPESYLNASVLRMFYGEKLANGEDVKQSQEMFFTILNKIAQ